MLLIVNNPIIITPYTLFIHLLYKYLLSLYFNATPMSKDNSTMEREKE
jgi:hypothetical protein